MIRRLAERADLPMPTVAISPAAQPNAFATGRGPKHAVVCATQGLLQTLPADEVEGVMAHELMHVKHRDILIGSVAAAIATAISFMAQMAMYSSMFGGRDRDRRDSQPAGHARRGDPRADRRLADPDGGLTLPRVRGRPRRRRAARHRPAAGRRRCAGSTPSPPSARWRSSRRRPRPTSTTRSPRPGRAAAGMARMFSTHPSTEERIARLLAM